MHEVQSLKLTSKTDARLSPRLVVSAFTKVVNTALLEESRIVITGIFCDVVSFQPVNAGTGSSRS